ncbi:MAG: hypothetical protein MZW92_35595 [Comamonadaceae bacterium]|nr:hypothetical protein [Comamonadaceae bacterium]
MVKHLRKKFEALRGEEKLPREAEQPRATNVDFDALVEAWADAMHTGREMTDRLFTKHAQARAQHRGDVHGRHVRLDQGLDQRRRARGAGAAVRGARGARRPLRDLRLLRHDPQALRAVPHQALRRAVRRARWKSASPESRPQDYTRMGVTHPPPDEAAERGRGARPSC